MDIKILGAGCAKCHQLERAVRATVESQGIDATVSKVEDIMDIMAYGVMMTPALVVDNKVVVKGRVPSEDEIIAMLKKAEAV
ncbi:MAG: TM0996/MTH895 family glutaredoxin-like protein [Bacteroidetes bacterium]|nr:TM0996/MTH895 family glutaredoxin-like protein [Bacteroidota bacterium]